MYVELPYGQANIQASKQASKQDFVFSSEFRGRTRHVGLGQEESEELPLGTFDVRTY